MRTLRRSRFAVLVCSALFAFGARSFLGAQTNPQSLGVSAIFQGYDFDNALGVDGAQLLMIPVSVSAPRR